MLAPSKENSVSKFLLSGLVQLQAILALAFVRRRYPSFPKLAALAERVQLRYQPRVSLENGRITGVEAQPGAGQGMQAFSREMLRVAEAMGLLERIDYRRLDHVCSALKDWDQKGLAIPCLSFDISGLSLCRAGFPEMVCERLDHYDIDPSRLEIEVNEAAVSCDLAAAEIALWKLNGIGVRLALDHFGRDRASLNFLRRFPFSTIKLDADLINLAPHDEEEGTIAASIIEVAHAMNITVVALGVETEAHQSFLTEHGCVQVQGPMLGSDMTAETFFDLCQLIELVALAPGYVDIDRTDPKCWVTETSDEYLQG